MDSGTLAANQLPAFDRFTDDGLPGDRFFFSCPRRREAIATLRFGIEARKGLILCTGDAGTGKSMLLHKLERELGADITCLVIADPYLSFVEIVRRLLRSLHADGEADSELAAVNHCQQLLRSQSAAGRITALVFDDAQHLRDDMLDQLQQNIIGVGNGERERNLAQVVWVGRPEIKERLSQPPLQSLGSLVAVEYRLQPPDEPEMIDYIRQRLHAADLPEELFEHEALGRIASYSGGNFRQANALCERAMRTATSSSRKQISAEIVDGAAKDLDLWQPRWVRKNDSKTTAAAPPPFSAPQDAASAPRQNPSAADDSQNGIENLADYAGREERPRLEGSDRNRFFIGSKYMVDYVRQRLRAADLPEQSLEGDALGRIASYSGDNFRDANALCDQALRTAQSSSDPQINSAIVDDAAKDLGLWPPRGARREKPRTTAAAPPPFSAPRPPPIGAARAPVMARPEPREPFRFQFADDNLTKDKRARRRGRDGRRLFVASLILLALGIPAVWLYLDNDVAQQAVGALAGKLEEIAAVAKPHAPPAQPTPVVPDDLPTERLSPSPLPEAQAPSVMPDAPQNPLGPPARVEEPVLPPMSPLPQSLPTNPPAETKTVAPPAASRRVAPEPRARPRADLATEVFKALQNRAISGVRVSINDHMVYLDGRVATERQRHAAELAAASVPGVRAVRNRLTVQ